MAHDAVYASGQWNRPFDDAGETYFGFTVVPITDIACWMYCCAWRSGTRFGQCRTGKLATTGHGIVAETDANYVPLRNRGNDYEIDRHVQRTQTFTGVKGLAEQDIMIQQSQGFIADRTRENLTATDAAVVKFPRRTVMEGARRLVENEKKSLKRPRRRPTRPVPVAGSLVRARRSRMCCSNGSVTIAGWCCRERIMLTAEENAILTETDADTPMGGISAVFGSQSRYQRNCLSRTAIRYVLP